MNVQTQTRDELVNEIAAAITKANDEWREGRMTSPSELDYVIDADRILTERLPSYIGSTDAGREFLADEIFEDCGETYVTAEDLAGHIFDVLTAEYGEPSLDSYGQGVLRDDGDDR